MEEFSPLDRFLLFATVGGMFASLAFYAAARTAKYWKAPFVRFARASRTFQSIILAGLLAVTALGGGKTNAPPSRLPPRIVRTIPAEDLPAWFVAMGYPATDADASGIPDCWEKWTHTRGFVSDADLDGDGLTNLAEFEAQTDPIRADTDGDGIDDATELASLAAGVADLDPLVPATFMADEPDTDENGIPDLWEGVDVPLFYGIDPDGFPWDVPVPEEAANNYDVTVSVTSSRHAVLSWGTDDGESILLPPCTNLSLRLRLSADEAKTVGLSPGSATGLWKANLRATWRPRPDQRTETDRIRLSTGGIVDVVPPSASRTAVLPGTIPDSPRRDVRRALPSETPKLVFLPRGIGLEGNPYCRIHGPDLTVHATNWNASPPYQWSVNYELVDADGSTVTVSSYGPGGDCRVRCWWKDGHEDIPDNLAEHPGRLVVRGLLVRSAPQGLPVVVARDSRHMLPVPACRDVVIFVSVPAGKHGTVRREIAQHILLVRVLIAYDPVGLHADRCVPVLGPVNSVVGIRIILRPCEIVHGDPQPGRRCLGTACLGGLGSGSDLPSAGRHVKHVLPYDPAQAFPDVILQDVLLFLAECQRGVLEGQVELGHLGSI